MSKIYRNNNGQLLVAIPKHLEHALGLETGKEFEFVKGRRGNLIMKPKRGGSGG